MTQKMSFWVFERVNYFIETIVLLTMRAVPRVPFVIRDYEVILAEPAIHFNRETRTNFRVSNSTASEYARYNCNRRQNHIHFHVES